MPALWGDPAPNHFDARIPWWIKALLVIAAAALAYFFLDARMAAWAYEHPIAKLLAYPIAAGMPANKPGGGDLGRELMFLEQFGQGVCSVLAVVSVALLDPAGRRRALALAIGCLLNLAVTHLIKDLTGRSRPFMAELGADGHWEWHGLTTASRWGSFPSAHTTAAFALASGLAWFYPRARALFICLALITGTQRVLHDAHYLSDAIAGMGIGVCVMRSSLAGRFAGRLIAAAPPGVRAWWMHEAVK